MPNVKPELEIASALQSPHSSQKYKEATQRKDPLSKICRTLSISGFRLCEYRGRGMGGLGPTWNWFTLIHPTGRPRRKHVQTFYCAWISFMTNHMGLGMMSCPGSKLQILGHFRFWSFRLRLFTLHCPVSFLLFFPSQGLKGRFSSTPNHNNPKWPKEEPAGRK